MKVFLAKNEKEVFRRGAVEEMPVPKHVGAAEIEENFKG